VKRRWWVAAAGAPVGALVLAAVTVCLSTGCSTIGYYAQSVGGHLAIVRAARPVPDWLAEPATLPALKARLELSQRIRDFAVTELKEPDNASYRRYADLHRSAAVWNVVAAPELSLTLSTWCFPVVGCVGYRGYYDREAANAFADGLRAQGLEVSVYGVPAYSTLGLLPFEVFADPLLNTFIDDAEGDLARLIFHELAHQIAFAKGDTVFNESFATAVERLGGERWLAAHAGAPAREEDARRQARRVDFQALTARYRDRLQAVFADGTRSDAAKRTAKAEVMAQLRIDYDALKRDRWGGYAGYDGWFARANNASFGVLAAYNQRVPDFERLFEREGRDFGRFYAEARRLAALPPAERSAALDSRP
jgi:predicted aminopeptidase